MFVLGLKSGYTVKYCLTPRDFPRAQAIFYCISRLESSYGNNIDPLYVKFVEPETFKAAKYLMSIIFAQKFWSEKL